MKNLFFGIAFKRKLCYNVEKEGAKADRPPLPRDAGAVNLRPRNKKVDFRMNRTVIITGASKGIGADTAILFAEQGYNVVINYNTSRESALLLQRSLAESGHSVIALKANVANRLEFDLLVKETLYQFGHIDVLINNAGIAQQGLFTELSEYDWDKIMDVDLKGMFHTCQAVLPHMISRKSGTIINLSSVWGITGAACEVAYSAAKAGVIGLTKALAKEVGPSGITVNCIAPGVIDTNMNANVEIEDLNALVESTPVGRIGTTFEIAKTALFLASEGAEYITGQVISPNGGMVI